MPNISSLVTLISDAVVAGLAEAGQLPLTAPELGGPGRILLGRQHDYEQSDAPRVIFTPVSSEFGPKDVASPSALRPMPERVIGTDSVLFEVRCWGRGVNAGDGGTNPDADYDATQALYQQVLASVHATCAGCYDFGAGTWNDAAVHVRRGREFVFRLTLHTPVYARLPLATTASPVPAPVNPPDNWAPAQTEPETTVTLTNPAGGTGTETI